MDCSFVEMPAEQILKLTADCIARVEAYRNSKQEDALRKYKADLENSLISRFFRKVFKKPFPTKDEMLKEIASYYFTDYGRMCFFPYFYENLEAAQRLEILAKHADKVNVSGKDLKLILFA